MLLLTFAVSVTNLHGVKRVFDGSVQCNVMVCGSSGCLGCPILSRMERVANMRLFYGIIQNIDITP